MGASINFRQIFLMVIFGLLSMNIHAQDKDKDKHKKLNIEVSGNCKMCKSRIEKASLKIKGVKYANWDIPSKELTLIFDENKCSVDDVKIAIAMVGHDTDSVKATDQTYNKLPPCCQYKDPNSTHMDHNTKP